MKVTGLTKKILGAGFFALCIMSASVSLTGCLTDDKKDTTSTVPTSTPWGAETVVPIAAQGNATIGSAVDLDAKKVMLSSEANAAQSTIDLVFMYSTGDVQIGSPVYAKAAGDVPLAANYDLTKVKDTQIARISTKPDDSQIAASTFEATPKLNNALVLDGGMYLVKTGQGKIAFISINDVQGEGASTSAKMTIALSGL